MDKRLRKEDFVAANEEISRFAGRDQADESGSGWHVCLGGYDLRSGLIVTKYGREWEHIEEWRDYDPLLDTPDLFLKFARLYDQGLSVELILEWAHEYGCLGLGPAWGAHGQTKVLHPVARPALYQAMSVLMDEKLHLMDDSDPVGGFWDEAILAAAVLKMYEAALFANKEEAENLVLFEFPFIELMRGFTASWWKPLAQDYFGESLARELREAILAGVREAKEFTSREREATTNFVLHLNKKLYGRDFLKHVFSLSMLVAKHRFQALCYPHIVRADPGGEYTFTNLKSGWGYRNLLGALYLQMHWVMTSGGNVVRCEHCGRIISLAKPRVPGARKPPRHKRFCNKYCRYNHHYQTTKKPAREGEGSS